MTSQTPILAPDAGTSAAPQPAVRLDNVVKTYGQGTGTVTALARVSLQLPAQSFTAIMGPSGSGKSTLMHVAAGLDSPTSGSVALGQTAISGMPERHLTRFRRDRVGFIFQEYNLLPQLTIEQNITLPLLLGRKPVDPAWFTHIVAQVGLTDLVGRRPHELSGGQQQRAAIARALITKPEAVFADEPTGALDSRTAHQVLELLRYVASHLQQTVVMVTHDPIAASFADTAVFLADGQIVGHLSQPDVASITAHMAQLGA